VSTIIALPEPTQAITIPWLSLPEPPPPGGHLNCRPPAIHQSRRKDRWRCVSCGKRWRCTGAGWVRILKNGNEWSDWA
jgi:hypothetical protein